MFEAALVESEGRLKTQSKYWMAGTFFLNAGVLLLMILIPLVHPEALPIKALTSNLIAPAPPVHAVAQTQQAKPAGSPRPETKQFTAPPVIPTGIHTSDEPPSPIFDAGPMGAGPDVVGANGIADLVKPNSVPIVVTKPKVPTVLHVSTGVAVGNLIVKTEPIYPAIAKAARVSGSVVLHAIISKNGLIENLSVQSGPVLLRQAALDGVRGWRYKPFLLNGEPTEVDTVITVNFTNGA